MTTVTESEVPARCLRCEDAETQGWKAWINLMPPPPDELHVVGEVKVANPGVEPLLTARVPQGFNPRILILDLWLCQSPGVWPQVEVWKPVRYDKVTQERYDSVEIYCGVHHVASVPVDEVH